MFGFHIKPKQGSDCIFKQDEFLVPSLTPVYYPSTRLLPVFGRWANIANDRYIIEAPARDRFHG